MYMCGVWVDTSEAAHLYVHVCACLVACMQVCA